MVIYQFAKGDPVMFGTYASSDDYYLNNYDKLDQPPSGGFRYPYGGAFYLQLQDGQPLIEQPFGIFNDCEHATLMGLFSQADTEGILYAMTARMDYVPFGYAVETQSPACFYKVTAEENCAPRMVGIRYDVVREDRALYIKGACYKPCTSLTKM
jgi:hypothetical protein